MNGLNDLAMNYPIISIIIPVFNAAQYIHATLQSVFVQTYKHYEIIAIDDGSTDGSIDILKNYVGKIKLISQRNGGPAKARNRGAAEATGEWLAFLDADDIWLPEKIEKQINWAIDGYGMVHSDRFNIGILDGLPHIQSDIQPLYEGDIFIDLLLKGNAITTSSVLISKNDFLSLGGFCEDPEVICAEDWDLWIRHSEIHPVAAIHEPLVQYRLHPTGLSRNPSRMTKARKLVIRRALALSRGRQLPAAMKRRIWAETWKTIGWDEARHYRRVEAFKAYARSLFLLPRTATLVGLLRSLIHKQ